MSIRIYDLDLLYRQTFGGRPYTIEGDRAELPSDGKLLSELGNLLSTTEYLGKEIWLPVKFKGLNASVFGANEILLPYTVIEISGKKTIVKTALADRRGTVKEIYSIDDYVISIKGFLIDEDRKWPEKELVILRNLFELNEEIELDNALTNVLLDKSTRVVIEELQFPPVEGGRKHIRPFSMKLESDNVFTLEENGV